MTHDNTLDRRRFLVATAGTAASATLLAGCSASGDEGDESGNGGGDGDGGDGGSGAPDAVADFLGDANNYDGVVDETGADEVTVAVGPGGNNSFDPAAVRVDAGTTVVWEWDSPNHNVVAENVPTDWSGHEDFENGGFTYEHTFEEAGEYLYVCTPHKSVGMKGAIIVE
ncbi:halocyanin domain-containing protein [Halostella sp. JP-L12]|uniref:halocyanin domain-containing protein n=1 Tax=Halostella TaxID=1843185 RepID=UPI000EF7F4FE|nr:MULTISPECIES: halocyanin domain-containing protein [Halostella]NHN49840.1 halocyanin domain-containing protein [Halostella sp. JP-L12]